MAAVTLKNINAGYGENSVLRDFSLSAEDGELVALLGASGCGKTTVLKIIAGLHEAEAGEIQLDGKNIANIPAEKRRTAMVFQKPLLFPYLTVAENVAFGLKMRNLPKNEIREKVAENLRIVQLEGFETRLPNQLSGGQEQRVSLARALVTNPRILLLDEPFSALDAELRIEMRNLVRELQRRLKITTVFVTHDQAEAVALADRIAFVDNGRAIQYATPDQFFVNPRTLETAMFFGWRTFRGTKNGNFLETDVGTFEVFDREIVTGPSHEIKLAFHPHQLRIVNGDSGTETGSIRIEAALERIITLAGKNLFILKLANGEFVEVEDFQTLATSENSDFDVTKPILISIKSDTVRYFI